MSPDTTTVLLSPKVPDEHRARLRDRFPRLRFPVLEGGGRLPDGTTDADAVLRVALTKPEMSAVLQAAPSVRWVHTSTAGFDWALVPEIGQRGIVLTRSAASYAIPIGEFTLALIATLVKRLPELAARQKEHVWRTVTPPELADTTVGLVGTGGIGREVAWRCKALGMRVIGTKRTPGPVEHVDAVLPADRLHELLSRADVVVVACPLTPETRGLIDAAAFGAMKETAYLINVARGPIVVEEALLTALHEGRIAGAAMDAFDEEPLPEDHPLWDAPDFLVTPHTSFLSPRNLDRVLHEFEENLTRFLAGEPLANALRDPELGY
jgi:phosphoglycerate dehydrogenase-like enzyme